MASKDLMPFGKYEGRPIEGLPRPYLVWLWEDSDQGERLYGRVKTVIEAVLAGRPVPPTREQQVAKMFERAATRGEPPPHWTDRY
jgi:hypothetical protein